MLLPDPKPITDAADIKLHRGNQYRGVRICSAVLHMALVVIADSTEGSARGGGAEEAASPLDIEYYGFF